MISVVVPNHNYAHYLGDCIQSILNQTYPDLEVLVCDDGSTDNSLEVAHGFADPRVRVLADENKNCAVARNRGIANARGDLVAFLDSDDMFTRDSLQLRLDMLGSYDLVTGRVVHVPPTMNLEDAYKSAYGEAAPNHFTPSTVLMRKSILDKHGGFPEIYHREDKAMWVKLFGVNYWSAKEPGPLKTDKCKPVLINDIVTYYRMHQQSKTNEYRRLPGRKKDIHQRKFQDAIKEYR